MRGVRRPWPPCPPGGMAERSTPYAVPLDDLESSARVRPDDLVETQPASEPEPLVPPQELDRQKALGVVGDFRLGAG